MRSYDIKLFDNLGKLEETITIKPVKRKYLADLIEANKVVIEALLKYNGGVGTALSDDNVWIAMTKVAKLCPVLGKDEFGFNLELIEDDYETLSQLFFTRTEYDNTIDFSKDVKPSVIATLNHLDFPGDLGKAWNKLKEEVEKTTKKKS